MKKIIAIPVVIAFAVATTAIAASYSTEATMTRQKEVTMVVAVENGGIALLFQSTRVVATVAELRARPLHAQHN